MAEQLQSELTTSGLHNHTFHVEGRPEGQGYLTQPEGGSKLGLVLIQERWGLNQSICITADKFSARGFTVILPDVYRGKCAKSTEQAGHYFSHLDWEGAVKDIEAAGLHLKNKLGCTKVGVLGFCMGGALSFAVLSATKDIFSAGCPFYGIPDQTKFPLQNIKIPVQAQFGDQDPIKGFSDPESAKKVEKDAQDLNLDIQIVMWKGGEHAFMNQNSVHYNPVIAEKALEDVSLFFQKHLN